MQITIRTLSKIEFTVTAEPADTVNQLKHKIAAATVDRFASRLLLTHNRHTLGDGSQSIDQYNVTEGSKITVVFRSGQVPVSAQLPVTPGGLAFQQERLLRNAKFSDLTVVCGSRTWWCHRAVLAQRCEFFEAACSGPWSEAETRTIDLPDDDPEAIDMFLLYLYTAELPKMNEVCLRDRLQRAHSAFKLGDKYNVPPLRNLGYAWVYLCIHRVMAVQAPPAAELFDWINGIWGWEIQGASLAKETILNGLVGNFDTIVGLDGFETLVRVNSDFVVDLLRALGEKRAE